MDHEAHATIDQLGRQVAATLGCDWRPNPADWAPGGHLSDPESGVELYVGVAHRDRDMLTIRAVSPKDSRGQVPYVLSWADVSINVSMTKSPSQIAASVQRRLLPEWLPLYEKGLEAIEASNLHTSTTQQVAAQIAEIVGVSRGRVDREHPGRVSFYGSPHPIFQEGTSSAEVSGDSVTLELHLSPSDALAILRHMTR